MDKKQLRECTLDVERLRKAADRLDDLALDYRVMQSRLETATQSLKVIATWAKCSTSSHPDLREIHNRAMDTLKLIGEIK